MIPLGMQEIIRGTGLGLKTLSTATIHNIIKIPNGRTYLTSSSGGDCLFKIHQEWNLGGF